MNAINEITICKDQAPEKNYNNCLLRCSCSQQTSGVTRGLREMGNLADRGTLASVSDLQVNTQNKNLRNNGESGCGWLY